MKMKKLISAICAAAIAVSSFAGLGLAASADDVTVALTPAEGSKVVTVRHEGTTASGGVLLHAVYIGGKLNSLESKPLPDASSEDKNVTFDTAAYTEFVSGTGSKLFAWRSIGEMIPYTVNIVPAQVTPATYTVTFDLNGASGHISAKTVEEGQAAAEPNPAPERTGYTFGGWYLENAEYDFTTPVTANIILVARWIINKYTVTWQNEDGAELEKDENVEYGATPRYDGATPTKEATDTHTYAFSGWTPTVTAVSGNITYTAAFTASPKTFAITYNINGHGTAPAETTYTYGTTATLPALSEEGYTFVGWYGDEETTGDAIETIPATEFGAKTFYAKWKRNTPDIGIDYTAEKLTGFGMGDYQINNADVTPVEGKVDAAAYMGGNISIVAKGETAGEDSEARVMFVPPRPQAPEGITATEESADGAADGTITVGEGYADMEYKPSADKSYSDVPAETITSLTGGSYSVRYKATGSAFASEAAAVTVTTKGKQTVVFKNEDGTVLETQQLPIGETPVYGGETPAKEATAQYTYTFDGWTPAISAVIEGGQTYTATFTSTLRQYTITWQNDDGTEIDTTEVNYGETPAHDDPTKAAIDTHTYSFSAWSPALAAVTGAATYKATFTATPKTFNITYYINDHGTAPAETTYTYGTAAELPALSEEDYIFAGWYDNEELNGEPVTEITAEDKGEKEFWAKWTRGTYSIVPALEDGTAIGETVFKTGDAASGSDVTVENLPKALSTVEDGVTHYYVLNDDDVADYTKTFASATGTLTVTYEPDEDIVFYMEGEDIEDKHTYTTDAAKLAKYSKGSAAAIAADASVNLSEVGRGVYTFEAYITDEPQKSVTLKGGSAAITTIVPYDDSAENFIGTATAGLCEKDFVVAADGTRLSLATAAASTSAEFDYIIIRYKSELATYSVTAVGDDNETLTVLGDNGVVKTGYTAVPIGQELSVTGLSEVIQGSDGKYYQLSNEVEDHTISGTVTSEHTELTAKYVEDDSIIYFTEGEDLGSDASSYDTFTTANGAYSGGDSKATKNLSEGADSFKLFEGVTIDVSKTYRLTMSVVNGGNKYAQFRTAFGGTILIPNRTDGDDMSVDEYRDNSFVFSGMGMTTSAIKISTVQFSFSDGAASGAIGILPGTANDTTPVYDYIILREVTTTP